MDRLATHSKAVVVLAAVLLCFILGIAVYLNQVAKSELAARESLFLAQKRLSELASDEARLKEIAPLEKVVADHRGTRAAFDASMLAGKLYLNGAQYERAQSWFAKAKDSAPGNLERQAALRLAGGSYEAQLHWKEASEQYDAGLKLGDSSMRPELLLSSARVMVELGMKDKALEALGKIKKDYPNSPYVEFANSQESQIKK